MTPRRAAFIGVGLAVLAATIGAPHAAIATRTAAELPARLSDAEFWHLSDASSEPGGTFHSDNFISNEGRYQTVIPALLARVKPGGVYVGVGPEQNFTYIAAVRPRMVFIVDIRRGNLHEHLLYKALMELSGDRAEFLSRLFSRPRPHALAPDASVEQLFAAYQNVAPTLDLYRQNLQAVTTLLTKHHNLPLGKEDLEGIDYVYRNAFYREGPQLGYALTGSGRVGQVPSYAELMAMTDDAGHQWSYLSTAERFAFVKDLESKNLIVPVVGNFGGPKALRAVGKYVRGLGADVSVFYLSNVEQYLRQDGIWNAFCANVATMPLDASSTFIRSTRGGGPFPGRAANGRASGVMFDSGLGEMQSETRTCATSR